MTNSENLSELSTSAPPWNRGDKVWEWTVISPVRIRGRSRAYAGYRVRCSCSTLDNPVVRDIHVHHLASGNTKSCGHYRSSWRPKRHHVRARSSIRVNPSELRDRAVIRTIWNSIKDRCGNPNVVSYADYGGRGISVWEPWVNDSEAFIDWALANLGPRPANPPGWTSHRAYYSIDRIDNNAGYVPGNLKWSDPSEQAVNQRRCPMFGVMRTPKASTWGYRIQRRGVKYQQWGFPTSEDARDARDAKLAELAHTPAQTTPDSGSEADSGSVPGTRRTVLVRAA